MSAAVLMALSTMPLRTGSSQIILPFAAVLMQQRPAAGFAALKQVSSSAWSLHTVAAAAAASNRRRNRSPKVPEQQPKQASQAVEQHIVSEAPLPPPQTDEQQQEKKLFRLLENAPHLQLMRGSEVPVRAASIVPDASSSTTTGQDAGLLPDPNAKSSEAKHQRGTRRGRSSSSSDNSTSLGSSSSSSSRFRAANTGGPTASGSPVDVTASGISTLSSITGQLAGNDTSSHTATTTTSSSSSSSDDVDDVFNGMLDDAAAAAIARIGRFLDFRERCAKEVLAKLQSLGYSREVAQQALAALQRSGLQSDARFAEMFVRGYWNSKAQSPSRLAYELRSRGVASEHIDAALAAVFGSSRQLPTREASNEQEEEAWQRLVDVCRQRAELTSSEPTQKRRAKLANWLQRRGHNMSTIFKIFEAVGI